MPPPSSTSHTPRPAVLWTGVAVGILAIASASILIRQAEAPPLSIAAYRVTLATLCLGIARLIPGTAPQTERNRKALIAAGFSGFFLALHFAFWITSVTLTSIASSVTLVSTTPLFVALISTVYLRERFRPRFLAGILLTLVGSALVAAADSSLSQAAMLGDLLAIAGAAMASGYLVAGRVARRSLALSDYALCSYGSASLILAAVCLGSGQPLAGFSVRTYTALCLLAVVPQLIGHTIFNWTLKYLSPTTVSVLILGEPIGATLLGHFVIGETVDLRKAPGLGLLGIGILLCALHTPTTRSEDPPRLTREQAPGGE